MTWRSTCNYLKLFLCLVPALFLSGLSHAQNPIVIENALPGNPYAEWGVPDFRDNRIAGFATKMSLNSGETVRFKINVQSGANFTMKIYRIGYYNGNGARLKHDFGTLSGTIQPTGISDPVTGILNCSNWSESASWSIPANAVSGLYIAKLERSGGGSNHIVFIVRNDASNSDLYLQIPDATWQAYNGYGGNSLYDGTTGFPGGHAVKVSYNRPFFPYNSAFNTDGRGADWYMNSEYPMIRWLERNGYDVTYTCSNDVANNGNKLLNHKVFITSGHDEYWSKEQRNNVEAARNAGIHLAFFTGNEVYWKTRWESFDGSEHRTLVCYKEGLLGDGTQGERTCGTKCDGSTPEWTGLWRTGGNYDAGKPENALVGQISWVEFPSEIGVPSFYKKLRFWRNTAVANLAGGQTAFLGNQTLGYEWDFEQYEDSYPAGRITMSSRTINTRTHKLSLYRHSSGALVFGAGTIQWSWGLDGQHWGGTTTVSPEMQQATVNLFADMGVQPGSLQTGLVVASPSADATPPSATISSPANGSTFASGATINITGTATDAGGGVVAGVEVSVDGGNTWKVATLNTIDGNVSWSYSWTTTSNGTFNIRCRGFDDSGNMGVAGAGINVNVGGPDITPPTVSSVSPLNGATGVSTGTTVVANFSEAINGSTVTSATFQLKNGANIVNATLTTNSNQVTLVPSSILSASTTYTVTIKGGSSGVKDPAGNALVNDYNWSFTTGAGGGGSTNTIFQVTDAPANPLSNDGQAISLGVRFRSAQNGFITGIRYYKGTGTTGTHTGHLWTNSGTQLAQVSFTNETASGWQQALFSSPVAINAGVTYVASYFSPSGDYAATKPYFTSAVVNGPLRGLADGEDGPNGIYQYSPSAVFPSNSFQSSNYWVDVVFTSSTNPDLTPPTVSSVTPLSGATGVSTGTTVVANFSEAINASTVTNSTFQLRGPGTTLVTATVSTSSNQITLTPSSALAASTTYTATITGGGSGVKDLAGNALANNFVWSFTTSTTDITPPTVTSVSPLNSSTGVNTATTVVANFSEPVNGTTVTTSTFQLRGPGGTLVTATVGTASNQITLTPSSALAASTTYTATITGGGSGVKDLAGNALASNFVWSFTTAAGGGSGCPCTVFQPSDAPSSFANDGTGIVLGMKFRSSQNGFVTGIRYYKGAGSSGTRIGSLWSGTGTLLAQVSFTNETASGWQQALFSSPVAITSGVTYVAAYFSPSGDYAATKPYFTTAVVNGPLRGLADGEDGPNGLYRYSSTLVFPNNGFQSSNYWADLVFTPADAGTSPVVTQQPVSQSVCAGSQVSFISAASGSPAPTVQWQESTNGTSWTNIGGATNGTLSLTATAGLNNRQYRAVWTNTSGTVNSNSAILTVNAIPASPIVTVTNNCGSSLLTASGFTGSLLWSTGATTTSITVASAGTYTVTQTVNGCTSAPGSGTAAPNNSSVTTPVVNVVNNCGSSVLTASGFTGSLLWSTGATTASITVNAAGTYTVTQTVNGCSSAPGSGVAAPKPIPATPVVTVVDSCNSSRLTASGFTGSLLWSNGATTPSITVTTPGTYTVTQTVNGCTSAAGSGTAAPKPIPTAPTVSVVNNCGNSVLTAAGFTGSLLWSNGQTTTSITVTTPGTYSVTQTVNGCTSAAGSGTAAPNTSSVAAPTVNVVNNCGNSVLTASGFTGSLLWSTGATTTSITVNTGGNYTVTQTISGCTSAPGSGLAAPKPVPVLSSSLTATANTGVTFSYIPTSATAGTVFNWSRAAVAGISNAAAAGTGNISENLVNTTNSSVNVTYVFTLSAGGCVNTQNVVVTVNPVVSIACTMNGSITSGFNKTAIPAGRYIWFNSVLDRGDFSGISGTVNFYITNSKITFTANNQQYILNVPDARIRFDALVLSASTQFVDNAWQNEVPRGYTNYVFMTGLAYQVPANLPGSISNIQWTADIGVDKTGIAISWKWAAAVYTSFSNHAGLNIKPIGGLLQNPYLNSDKAGTPENFKAFVVGGAKGGGGTNYTGGYSGTSNIACTPVSNQRSPVTIQTRDIRRKLPVLQVEELITNSFDVKVMPNPSTDLFNMIIEGNGKEPVSIRVFDIFGQLLERHDKIFSGKLVRLGQNWKNGTYIAEVIQGTQRKVVKIIKVD